MSTPPLADQRQAGPQGQPLGSNPTPPFDYQTPGEPEAYWVPEAYRRPYGQLVRDRRGKGYYPAVMALSAVVSAYLVAILGGELALAAFIPAILGLVLGIRALRLQSAYPRTQLAGRTSLLAWLAIGLGALSLPLMIVLLYLPSWFMEAAETANCQYTHAGDEAAIQRCIIENTQ
ncbi:MAG: hypothetical protein SOR40_03100 [Rothia sp. (in: high G+C Gram-positive bacteria)]|nr:hypothetical protein [Rothia sp. (in: high G+C Gram-positive bacteria)]